MSSLVFYKLNLMLCLNYVGTYIVTPRIESLPRKWSVKSWNTDVIQKSLILEIFN